MHASQSVAPVCPVPPRIQCLAVFMGGAFFFALLTLLIQRDDPAFASTWLPYLGGVLLVHGLTFLFFIHVIERQTGLLVRYLLHPAPAGGGVALDYVALEAILRTDPLGQPGAQPKRSTIPLASLQGVAALAVFLLLSLGMTLCLAALAFPSARDLSQDALTMPGVFVIVLLLAGGMLANQRFTSAAQAATHHSQALREALVGLFGTMEWHCQSQPRYVASLTTSQHKERQATAGQQPMQRTVITREQTIASRSEHLARVELLLDPADKAQRVLLALLRQGAGVQGLPQDATALAPVGITCSAEGCAYHQTPLAQADLMTMAMRLAQHILQSNDPLQLP